MSNKIKVQTPAKINLSLEITNKLPNGFHAISSIMQTVSLYDNLIISIDKKFGENQIILSGNNSNIPYDENNIIYKVLKLYLEKAKINGVKINVDITKNIPTEAGLAGGSTNGAGALLAINELFNNELSKENLHTIASKVGSDLNFCLEGGACLLSSRGEIIEKKLPHKDFNIIILKPKNISISTPLCYKKFSEKYFKIKEATFSKKIVDIFENEFELKKFSEFLYNDLEKPAIDMFLEIKQIKENLIEKGCLNSLMSGSGSSVFGIFENDIEISPNNNMDIFKVKTSKGIILQ